MDRPVADAWLFLSVAFARKSDTASLSEVIETADGIMKTLPLNDELIGGINRLVHAGFLSEEAGGLSLTRIGETTLAELQGKVRWDQLQVLAERWATLADPPTPLWSPSLAELRSADDEYRHRVRDYRRRWREEDARS